MLVQQLNYKRDLFMHDGNDSKHPPMRPVEFHQRKFQLLVQLF